MLLWGGVVLGRSCCTASPSRCSSCRLLSCAWPCSCMCRFCDLLAMTQVSELSIVRKKTRVLAHWFGELNIWASCLTPGHRIGSLCGSRKPCTSGFQVMPDLWMNSLLIFCSMQTNLYWPDIATGLASDSGTNF